MNYPFLYKILNTLNADEIKRDIKYSDQSIEVWGDWKLIVIQSDLILKHIESHFSHLKIFKNKIFISKGNESNFHIDRYHFHHLLHRILIPLNENFKYEWILNDKKISYSPKKGEVILFNNMQPHRFVSESDETREVIYFDLYDPLVADYLNELNKNYSQENAMLEKKYN